MSIGQKEVFALIKALTGQTNILTIPRVFIAMTGETDTALLLGQILYWSDRTTDAEGWFYKSAKEWDEELGLSTYQVNRSIKLLAPWGVQTKLKKANGAPTTHYRLDGEQFYKSISKFLKNRSSRNSQNGFARNAQNRFVKDSQKRSAKDSQIDVRRNQKSLTETTSETSSETTNDVVAALSALGLTKRQATAAVKQHQLTNDEVDQWREWKAGLTKADNATAMLAALIKEQRLPPLEQHRDRSRQATPHIIAEHVHSLVEVPSPDGTLIPTTVEQIWNTVLQDLKGEISYSEFETWIKPSLLVDIEEGLAIVSVPNIFVRQELENRFLKRLRAALEAVLGSPVNVQVVIGRHIDLA